MSSACSCRPWPGHCWAPNGCTGKFAHGYDVQSVETRLRALLIDAMAGDALAYQTFLSELTRHLRGFLRRRIPQLSDDVEDLVQEILLAVHNGRHTFRADEPLTAWVHAIARYK